MPRLYLIIRCETESTTPPTHKTSDITTTGVPPDLKSDAIRIYATHTVIDNEAANGPEIYQVSTEAAKRTVDEVHISYGATSQEDVSLRFNRIPAYAKEVDKERKKINPIAAQCTWCSPTRIMIGLKPDRFLWYELVEVDVVAEAEDDSGKGGDKKRVKSMTTKKVVDDDPDR
jgi:hypothetical protein